MGYVPTGLACVAVVVKVAVMLSPFLIPTMLPSNGGLGWPYSRDWLLAVTVSGAGLICTVMVAEVLPSKKLSPLKTAAMECEDRKSTRLNSSHANISYAV